MGTSLLALAKSIYYQVKVPENISDLISSCRNFHQKIRMYYITREFHKIRCNSRENNAEEITEQGRFLNRIFCRLAFGGICDNFWLSL